MRWDEAQTIPEMLGFAGPDDEERNRVKPFSAASYRARYLLYEDEITERRHEESGAITIILHGENGTQEFTTHDGVERELNWRYIHMEEYKSRVDGGYLAMERKMREAGLVPQEEQDIVDRLNAEEGDPYG